jgi:hypothetical protein
MPPTDKRPFQFDGKAYFDALRKELWAASRGIREELVNRTRAAAGNLEFKTNKVNLANGLFTSDAERAGALINSIVGEKVERFQGSMEARALDAMPWSWKPEQSAMRVRVTAMEKGDYEKTHIGNYYEYGTGAKERPGLLNKVGISMGDDNPFRPPKSGKPVVTRPDGLWTDMGGNVRKSYGRGGISRSESRKFSQFIGPDIRAHRWFEQAFKELQPWIIQQYSIAARKVDFRDYFDVKRKIVIGKKGRRR